MLLWTAARLIGKNYEISCVKQCLRMVRCSVSFQWVPGHCGLLGNDLADQAAREAAADQSGRHNMPVSFAAARALILRSITDSPPERRLVQEVYSHGPIVPFPTHKKNIIVSRLRSGHSAILAGFRARFGLGGSSTCPHCEETDEDLEHWLCHCSASMALRLRCFGTTVPPLSVLSEGGGAVVSYLRGLRLL